ncbi:MAG: protein tyrosine phosphatase [Alphaproteobacteria bacterium]|nr:tyrosine phosphatase family protein [Beijerinckiaceae bacterium]NBQ39801.1 protein tyrosine phosphatase [Alphaproteobacteria bacterium]
MAKLHVCSLSRLQETVDRTGAKHVVTLLTEAAGVPSPNGILPMQHLKLIASDITAPMEGHILPGAEHVEQLIAFVKAWDRVDPMVIHCWAGISRSTASAYIAASVLNPELDDVHLATRLRAAAPSATPNPRLIALADAILDRKGRMMAAIADIGRGTDAFEGTPFELVYD